MRKGIGIALALLLSACGGEGEKSFGDVAGETIAGTAQDTVDTLRMPFEDLNLVSDEIPKPLAGLAENPYVPPPKPFCKTIAFEAAALNEVLGPDIGDAPPPLLLQDGAYAEKAAEIARHSAVSFVRGQVNVMPFRSVVRRISGAERHSKEVARAFDAGRLRRAYLKGLSLAYQCK
jgi:hypothetical protein